MRKLNTYTLSKIKQWEGHRLTAYQDQAGVWTIGYGHTGPEVVKGLTITMARATQLLKKDIAWAEKAVSDLVKVPLTDNQFGALVSFVFNVGGAAFKSSTLLKKLNGRQYTAVPSELAKWNKITVGGKKVTNKGLVNRRAAEAGLWAKGEDMASNTVEAESSVIPPSRDPGIIGKATASTGGAGFAIEGLAEPIGQATDQVSFLAEYSPYLRALFGLLVVAGIGLMLYSTFKKKKD